MNLGDPDWELIDPTPDVHSLFILFDKTFFCAKLANRAVVRWSKRMYSCAGVCSYEGRGGLCAIALSEPLLKLRPRKDLVETLLHEMIHAYLFITLRVQDRDGHGPNFKEHMYRINKAAGVNISIYHDFHDEVELYQTHWWRCNGPCQFRKPHFGIVRRSRNCAPGPKEYWWAEHQRKCGGTFVKIKEPEKKNNKMVVAKPMGDITKYITNSQKTTMSVGEPKIVQIMDINVKSKVQTKSNNSSTVIVTQKGYSPLNVPAVKSPSVFAGKGNILTGPRVRSNSVDASEAVRNIWAKKQFTPKTVLPIAGVKGINSSYIQKPTTANITPNKEQGSNSSRKAIKQKPNSEHVDSPPFKVKKIDDYFKASATSLLKDIYGSNIEVAESTKNNKLIAVTNTNGLQVVLVDCPICKLKIEQSKINGHLDECLNKDLIAEICNNSQIAEPSPKVNSVSIVNTPFGNDKNKLAEKVSQEILATLPPIPPYKPKLLPQQIDTDGSLDYSTMKKDLNNSITTFRGTFRNETKHWVEVIKEPKNLNDNINWNDHLKPHVPKTEFDPIDIEKAKTVVKKVQFDKHLRKSDNFSVPKEEKDLESGYLPSFIVEDAKVIKLPPIKIEPGTCIVSALTEQKCPCCGNKVTKPIDEHLDECLAFFATDRAPEEPSTSFANHTIVIDDDEFDIFDESQVFNATGTKLPCPCCLQMVENIDMNTHLNNCLN